MFSLKTNLRTKWQQPLLHLRPTVRSSRIKIQPRNTEYLKKLFSKRREEMHLNITLRQQERLCVSCLSKLGLAFPMKPDFHNRLRCSLPELNLRANLHQLKSELAPKSCLSTCAPAEDSPAMCRGGGGKGSHTSLSPPFSPPPCLPSLGMMADPTPGLSTRSLHPPWQDQV